MSTGSKRPSPDAEEDCSTHPSKRCRSQDDTKVIASRQDKGKGREVEVFDPEVEEREAVPGPSPPPPSPPLSYDKVTERLTQLKCNQTSGRPTTSARARLEAEEIAYLEQIQRLILSRDRMAQEIHRLNQVVAGRKELITQLYPQAVRLAQVRQALNCPLCFDTLDRPYALSPCGHVACYKCLLRWFTITDDVAVNLGDTSLGHAQEQEFMHPVNGGTSDGLNFADDLRTPVSWASGGKTGGADLPAPTTFVDRPKICPMCRMAVNGRPLELFTIQNVVQRLGKGSPSSSRPESFPASSAFPSYIPQPRRPTDDPWNNIFRDANHEHPARPAPIERSSADNVAAVTGDTQGIGQHSIPAPSTRGSSPQSTLPRSTEELGKRSACSSDSGYASTPGVLNAGRSRTLRSGKTYDTLISSRAPSTRSKQPRTAGTKHQRETVKGNDRITRENTRMRKKQRERVTEARRSREREVERKGEGNSDAEEVSMVCGP